MIRSQQATHTDMIIGDGKTDDTSALNAAIQSAVSAGQVLYLDHGDYLVTGTIDVPAGAQIVGESYSVILSSGDFFNDESSPQPVVRIGQSGDSGTAQLSDLIVSSQGTQAGAILIQYNLAAPAGSPSGLWDVHTRIGGFAGSDLQLAQCPTTPNSDTVNTACMAAFMSLHITSGASGLYLEANWFWTADHDVEDASETQITVYTGRGLLDESAGPVWMVGTGVEHHQLYQFQFANAANVFAGFIQTETPYWQPNPDAASPYAYSATYNDPQFSTDGSTDDPSLSSTPQDEAWGLRILDSTSILIYGAGHYSFFNDYNVTCSDQGLGSVCQSSIVSIEGSSSSISIYNLNTVGSQNMVTVSGTDVATAADNNDGFEDTIALFRTS